MPAPTSTPSTSVACRSAQPIARRQATTAAAPATMTRRIESPGENAEDTRRCRLDPAALLEGGRRRLDAISGPAGSEHAAGFVPGESAQGCVGVDEPALVAPEEMLDEEAAPGDPPERHTPAQLREPLEL